VRCQCLTHPKKKKSQRLVVPHPKKQNSKRGRDKGAKTSHANDAVKFFKVEEPRRMERARLKPMGAKQKNRPATINQRGPQSPKEAKAWRT